MGDSKTWLEEWQTTLVESNPSLLWQYVNAAEDGMWVKNTWSTIHDILDPITGVNGDRIKVLFNLGINDVINGLPDGVRVISEAGWKADLNNILALVHSKWPSATIYIAKPWGSWAGVGTHVNDADLDTLAGWINDVVASHDYCAAGIDERDAAGIQSTDDGATYTTDGIHYSAAGNAKIVALWRAVLGY